MNPVVIYYYSFVHEICIIMITPIVFLLYVEFTRASVA